MRILISGRNVGANYLFSESFAWSETLVMGAVAQGNEVIFRRRLKSCKHGKKECSGERNSFFSDVLRAEAREIISEKPARSP